MQKRIYRVPAVIKTLDILEYLGKNGEVSFTDIHSNLHIPKGTVYQILETLRSRGYVRLVGDSSKYFLGFRLFELGTQIVSRVDIRAEALPALRELSFKTKQTCHLSILDGIEGVYLIKVEGSQPIRINTWEGKRLPLHSTATGKALLAWIDKEKLREILKKLKLTRFTGRTITRVTELKRHLEMVRKQGWALDDQENEAQIKGIAAPILNIKGEAVAAISIGGLAAQIDSGKIFEISELVKNTAQKISGLIGNKTVR